jgi:hypothetical protein
LGACGSDGSVSGPWSKLSHDGTDFTETDTQGLFIQSTGNINSSSLGETIIDWTFDLSDLTGIPYLCIKVGSNGAESTEFIYASSIQIDNIMEVSITDYSLTEIANIVESNDAKVLSSYIVSNVNSAKLEVIIKVSKLDLSSLLQTFERYNYQVNASFGEEADYANINDNYDSLMNYLNI